ncbi:hypothetical protein Ccrd_024180 [Cynara cardunculus var. scolymus]|uniref:PCI domain-containing protein n=1 Tax=Cynara cardunculus var. scolymus TaxID=59895 RepID=A0A118JSI0_CYNCS|nr:hypothetical protein Ccrd_024180 [Cynara cardunculus var. scolymus]
MDIEQKQEELIEHFVNQASTFQGSSLATVIIAATSHPSLFAFSEILSVPNVIELQGTEHSIYLDLLRMFAHGTWSEYKSSLALGKSVIYYFFWHLSHFGNYMPAIASKRFQLLMRSHELVRKLQAFEHILHAKLHMWNACLGSASILPPFAPDQVLKLKQLTVLTLAETNKFMGLFQVLPYDVLMQELDVVNVRELEDFLINECMYVGIVRGKLDQFRRCFQKVTIVNSQLLFSLDCFWVTGIADGVVKKGAARVGAICGREGSKAWTIGEHDTHIIKLVSLELFSDCSFCIWLSTSDNLLISIQEKIKWADTMSDLDKKHKKEADERMEEVKKALSLKATTSIGLRRAGV